ncbi:NAD(P)-dependent oxidoreductase [Paraburkholderia sediminicola]|uniref:NAD(P)-dependent oxidoreductase n=1 Tax=Paraburkholderia sediminicola TaxID=458836 RepID=UPI0038B917C3
MSEMNEMIGFIGLGVMGAPMAGRLIDAGRSLVVSDSDPRRAEPLVARGAHYRGTPAEVAHEASMVFVCLPGPAVVSEVALGVNGLHEGQAMRLMIDLSTSGPRVSAQIAQHFAGSRMALVDAPVSGGQRGAAAGTLTLMAAGDPDHYRQIEPLLRHLGRPVFCGPRPGQGQLLKVINNMMSTAALAVTAEAFALGQKGGLDPQLMLDVINASSGRNSATEDKFPHAVLTRKFGFGFPVRQSLKDLGLCLAEADELGVPMLVARVVKEMLLLTGAEFGFDADFTHIARLTQKWAHLDADGPASGTT